MALLINFLLVYIYIYISYSESARLNFLGENTTCQGPKSGVNIHLEIPSKMVGLNKKPYGLGILTCYLNYFQLPGKVRALKNAT